MPQKLLDLLQAGNAEVAGLLGNLRARLHPPCLGNLGSIQRRGVPAAAQRDINLSIVGLDALLMSSPNMYVASWAGRNRIMKPVLGS